MHICRTTSKKLQRITAVAKKVGNAVSWLSGWISQKKPGTNRKHVNKNRGKRHRKQSEAIYALKTSS